MNQINRNNYESFFLLYTDNELPDADRKAVEAFVAANPDLAEELSLLQETILKPGNIFFGDMERLLKKEPVRDEVEEKLLLLLDNELAEDEKQASEKLIASDAATENEWNILQQTKLQPDEAIVFPDKSLLYKKESTRIVTIPWRKIAVAALLIGFGAWGAVNYLNRQQSGHSSEVVITKQPKKQPAAPTKTAPVTTTGDHQQADESLAATTTTNTAAAGEKNIKAERVTYKPQIHKEEVVKNTVPEPQIIKPKDNNLPKSYLETINKDGGNNTTLASVTPSKKAESTGSSGAASNTPKQDVADTYIVTTASYNDNNAVENNHVLYMDEEKVKKTKIAGFFRKVKRVIERNANIKTGGNNLKVANLEFAIQ